MSFPLRSTVVVVAAACVAVGAYAGSTTSVVNFTSPTPKVAGLTPSRLAPAPAITQMIVKYKHETASAHVQGLSAARMTTLASRTGLKLTYRRPMSDMAHVLRLPKAVTVAEAQLIAAQIAQDPNVEYAQPDYVRRASLLPNDPLYTSVTTSTGLIQGQWHLYAPTSDYTYKPSSGISTTIKAVGGANLPPAWDVTAGSGVVVGIVDTGITSHTELNSNLVGGSPAASGYDFISGNAYNGSTDPNAANPYFTSNDGDARDSDPSDPGDWVLKDQCGSNEPTSDENSSWHGTHVAGTIAARTNNGVGVAGIAYQSNLLIARALGKCGGLSSDISDAIQWAAGASVSGVPTNTHPAKVINLSLGGSTANGPDHCSSIEQAAVTAARAQGAVVVAATGNDGTGNIASPASCSGVIAVTANTVEGDNADYANIGNSGEATPVNSTTISAPGGGCGTKISTNCADQYVWSTMNSGTQGPSTQTYGGAAGTSMATPHVSGVAALIKAVQSSATPDYVRLVLQGTAREFPAGTYCLTTSGRGKCGAGMLDAGRAVTLAQAGGPAVFAGLPQVVTPGATVTLHGEALPLVSGTTVTTSWSVLSGSANLSSTSDLSPTFTASTSGEIKLQLTANDGSHTSTSTTTVYVESAPVVTVASNTVTVTAGSTASFTASATDADGDTVSFVMDSGPSAATFTGAGIFTWTSAGPAGTYPVVIRAYDGALYSAPVTVNVVVTAAGGGSSGGGTSSGGGGGGAVGLLGFGLLALGAWGLRRNRALVR